MNGSINELWLNIGLVIFCLCILVWSADIFINNAANLANQLGMPTFLVGMLIVGFGTSAPEMVVSVFASLDNNAGIALGNAYGSNIANIGLVLGVTVVAYPFVVSSRIVKREIPLLVVALIVCYGFLADFNLTRIEAALMLLMIVVLMIFNTIYGNAEHDPLDDALVAEVAAKQPEEQSSILKLLLFLLLGLGLLLISAHYLVQSAVSIAKSCGVSDLFIGLTIVAIGTSLPELASSLVAAKKGESDIVLGNIIGSCLFNALAVVGIAGVVAPLHVSSLFLYRDLLTGFLLTLLLWVFVFGLKKPQKLTRLKGGVLLLSYAIYSGVLLLQSV